MDTNLKSTEPGAEPRNIDMFKGAVSWISFMILLCGMTIGLMFLLFISLDPILAGNIGTIVRGFSRSGWNSSCCLSCWFWPSL